MKKMKKIVIPGIVIAVVAAILWFAVGSRMVGGTPTAPMVDTYAVTRGELANTVDVTGVVESGTAVGVYTKLSYPVIAVDVKVGDKVQAGDILCTLDTSDLESTIRQNQALLNSAQAKARHSLELARKDYETVLENVNDNYDAELLGANTSVKDAQAAVDGAEAKIRSAENTLELAEYDLKTAREDLRELRDDDSEYDSDIAYDTALTSAKRGQTQAEIALESAQQTLEEAKRGLTEAKRGLTEAQTSANAIEKRVGDTVEQAKDGVVTAELSTDLTSDQIALQKLREDMGDAVLTAPISGTVTAVYAEEGAPAGTGLLFMIEDTNDLKVAVKIKEYDVADVSVGLPVSIKADGTGEAEFEGAVSMISPTTLKDATTGKTVDASSPEFLTEIKVKGSSELRIGMKARLRIITEKKDDVLSVPAEAVTMDEEGNQVIFVIREQERGEGEAPVTTVEKMTVSTGMETDFYLEVLDSALMEGDAVVTNPSGLVDGMNVTTVDDMGMGDMAGAAMLGRVTRG